MAHDCPLCGSRIDDLPLSLLPDRGMVVAGGKFVLLPSAEMALLARLAEIWPRVLSKEAAMTCLYSLRPGDQPDIKIVDVWICKIRRKLKPLGLRIDTSWGRGYALAVDRKPQIISEAVA